MNDNESSDVNDTNPDYDNEDTGTLYTVSSQVKLVDLSEEPSDTKDRSFSVLKTPWASVWLAAFVSFLSSLQFSMYFSSTYPFMKQVDKNANESFFGWIIAIFSIGQMISSTLFGYLSNRMKEVRKPTAIGLIVCSIGNLVYAFSQSLDGGNPTNHKWVLFASRSVVGFGAGYVGPMRAYFATAATLEDRAKSISIGSGAFTLGFAVGPAIQALFSYIGYPGIVWGPVQLNLYTVPSILVVICLLLCVALLFTIFEETYAGIVSHSKKSSPFYALPKYDYISVALLIYNWFCILFTNTAIEVLLSPVSMVFYDWTNAEAVKYNGFLLAGSAVISLLTTFVVGYYLSRMVDDRKLVICGLTMMFSYYLFTFAYPNEAASICPGGVACLCPHNTTSSGYYESNNTTIMNYTCAPNSWYQSTPKVPLGLVYGVFPLISIGIPMVTNPLATHLSKVVGPRRQGTVQGTLMAAGSFGRTIGPLFMSYSFEWYGPRVAWGINMVIIIGAVLPWLCLYKRAVPLNTNPSLKPGDHFKYKKGKLYRF